MTNSSNVKYVNQLFFVY